MADSLQDVSSVLDSQTPLNSKQLESIPIEVDSEIENVEPNLNASDYRDDLGQYSLSSDRFINELIFSRGN